MYDNTVFIAGSTGIVGSSIVRYILEYYPKIKIRASLHNTDTNLIYNKRVEYIQGDLRSKDYCKKIAKDCDYVIMAAATTFGSNILINDPWRQINDILGWRPKYNIDEGLKSTINWWVNNKDKWNR